MLLIETKLKEEASEVLFEVIFLVKIYLSDFNLANVMWFGIILNFPCMNETLKEKKKYEIYTL